MSWTQKINASIFICGLHFARTRSIRNSAVKFKPEVIVVEDRLDEIAYSRVLHVLEGWGAVEWEEKVGICKRVM